MIVLAKTNVPGFSKNKKTNVIVNTSTEKINSAIESRKRYKKQQLMEVTIADLETKYTELLCRIQNIEARLND